MAQINSMEWLLADGALDLGDGPVTTTELFLGPGGPLLSTEGRAYLGALRRQPLQLYEVVESMPGEGLVLQDARDPEAQPCRVMERAASQSISVGEIVEPLAAMEDMPETNSGTGPEIGIPPERRQELHRQIYRSWADEPIPALGDATPREAAKTERGRRQVERLLSSYETQDARTSRQTGEEAMDFGFLWEAVGLEPPV